MSGNLIFFIGDVVALYPGIQLGDTLETPRPKLFKREDLKLLLNNTVKMAEFIPKNNIFEFKWEGLRVSRGNSNWYFFPLMLAFTWMR